jgi:exodeoxyribonuclease VII large subunit
MSETDSASLFSGGEPRAANALEYSVSEISSAIKKMVEDGFAYVRVRGELSGVKRHSSGHVYLDLKDERACLAGVIWGRTAQRLRVQPENGLDVVATGRLTTYPGQSKYQIVIEQLQLAGLGALMQQLEQRRKALAAEGLFDEAHKKPLPFLPEVVGVVTSPTGAVIRDILHRLADRFPRRVLVWPVAVQGERSAAEIAAAIKGFNALPLAGPLRRPDVLIVARGGGSIEDLWSFNEEIVVRAAFAGTIPLISAVGHETDTTLIDHVADRRAPTPTAAAEMAVPVRADLVRHVLRDAERLEAARQRLFTLARQRLTDLTRALPRREAILAIPRQRFDFAASKLASALLIMVQRQHTRFERAAAALNVVPLKQASARRRERVAEVSERLALGARRHLAGLGQTLTALGKLLETLSYKTTLSRGYAFVAGTKDRLIRRAADIASGERLTLTFADGTAGVTADGEPQDPKKPRTKVKPAGQGDLF